MALQLRLAGLAVLEEAAQGQLVQGLLGQGAALQAALGVGLPAHPRQEGAEELAEQGAGQELLQWVGQLQLVRVGGLAGLQRAAQPPEAWRLQREPS